MPAVLFSVLASACAAGPAAAEDGFDEPNQTNPQAIQNVQSGEYIAANAAWWGFDPQDATNAVQSAINSGAEIVLIPYTGSDWILRPIFLASNQEIVIEPGVVIAAKAGHFRAATDCLFTGREIRNVLIQAHGALLRMNRAEYASPQYTNSDSRHLIALLGVNNVEVVGPTLQSSGGAGVYIGPTADQRRLPCRGVRIADCLANENLTGGISIVSGQDIRVENCTIRNTRGSGTESGVQVEPATPTDKISDVEIRTIVAVNNAGSGFVANLSGLDGTSAAVSLRFVDCIVKNSGLAGVQSVLRTVSSPPGLVEFINCTIDGTDSSGASVVWNTSAQLQLRMENCKWRDASRQSGRPLHLELSASPDVGGGIDLVNCYLYDQQQRTAIQFVSAAGGPRNEDVYGLLHVINDQIGGTYPTGGENLPNLAVDHHREQR